MAASPDPAAYAEELRQLKDVRAKALEHYRLVQQFHAERRDLLRTLIGKGFSQAGIARELGVRRPVSARPSARARQRAPVSARPSGRGGAGSVVVGEAGPVGGALF